jgi:hypothetical protein
MFSRKERKKKNLKITEIQLKIENNLLFIEFLQNPIRAKSQQDF